MIELREFVKETLVQLIQGVADAQAATTATGGLVAPGGMAVGGDLYKASMVASTSRRVAQMVEFDLAVTGSESGAKAVTVGVVAEDTRSESRSTNRIKFAVPVLLPEGRTVESPPVRM
jgi:hypothetical protein